MTKNKSHTLIEAFALGNREAYAQFFEVYYEKVFSFVHYFLTQKEECEDVVSDVFYLLWEKSALLSEVKNIESYLYVVSRNESFKYLNKKKSEQKISIDDMPVDLCVEVNTADSELLDSEMMQVFHQAINELPERCKLIFLMVREQKLKYKEIATLLTITEGTIEAQMNIAIKKITKIVKKHYPLLDYHKK